MPAESGGAILEVLTEKMPKRSRGCSAIDQLASIE
jgi:hypothetical protein